MKKHIFIVFLTILMVGLWAQAKHTITDSYNAETAGNYSRALEIMTSIVSTDNNDEFYQLRIGWLKYLLGQYQEAQKAYQLSNKIGPNLDAQIGILNCSLALGKWSESLSLANEILKNYPQNTVIMGKAAYAAYMKQEYKTAADYYARIIKINPWDMENRGYLINNLYLSKDLTEAKKHYIKLKKYYPESSIVKEYSQVLD